MMRQVAVCAMLLWSATSSAVLSEHEVDILNRPVAPLLEHGRPTMVLYANRATQDAVRGPATRLAVRLHDIPFVTVVHIDLRGIPHLFYGIARATIRRSQQEGVQNFERAFRRAGVEPPADAGDRLLLVPDKDGAPHQAMGLPEGFSEALAIVFDAQGHEVGRGAFPRQMSRIEAALCTAAHRICR